jgi:hypothetical protein
MKLFPMTKDELKDQGWYINTYRRKPPEPDNVCRPDENRN